MEPDHLLDPDSCYVRALPSMASGPYCRAAFPFPTLCSKMLSRPQLSYLHSSLSDQSSAQGRCAFWISGLFLKVTHHVSA